MPRLMYRDPADGVWKVVPQQVVAAQTNQPYAYRYLSAAQSIPNNAFTAVLYDTAVGTQIGITYNAATGEFTLPEAGIYLVSAVSAFAASSAGTQRAAQIQLNGTPQTQAGIPPSASTAVPIVPVATILNCAQGDKIIVAVYQASGAALNTYNGQAFVAVQITKVALVSGMIGAGPAGGDLGGTYPNPSIVNGAKGKVVVANGSMADATTYTTVADGAGLSVTWTADPTRMYKVTFCGSTDQITANAQQSMYITDGSNVAIETKSIGVSSTAPLQYVNWLMSYYESGLSGSITRKVRAAASAGTGRWRTGGKTYLLVEDIGPA